ncbi:MAG: hypothetical protein ABW120_13390, partial [Sedimenticola sp.]
KKRSHTQARQGEENRNQGHAPSAKRSKPQRGSSKPASTSSARRHSPRPKREKASLLGGR